jgi:hypothetical protein
MRRAGVLVAVFLVAGFAAPPARAQSAGDQDVVVDVPSGDEYADTDPSALSDFSPALDPYGTWVQDPTYGMVWVPNGDQAGATFQPYDTAGSWKYVDGDYVWVSDFAWGWVCFHYGRWALSAGRWEWIPGRRYAGAWVNWSLSSVSSAGDSADGYIGWAPMAPTWFWTGGTAITLSVITPQPWTFSSYRDFLGPNVSSHVVTGSAAAAVASHSRPYVPAQPSVTTGPLPPSAPHAPPPAMLGLDVSHLALAALSVQESRARQLARPSTAIALGARPPARHVLRPVLRPEVAPRGLVGAAREPSRGRR